MMSERAVEQIFSLFDKFGSENYIGENVSQLQHAQQVTELAAEQFIIKCFVLINQNKLLYVGFHY